MNLPEQEKTIKKLPKTFKTKNIVLHFTFPF